MTTTPTQKFATRNDLTLGDTAGYLPDDFKENFGGRFELVGFRPLTAHPDDAYLMVVIGERTDGTFAKWTYNAYYGGFNGGFYDLDLDRALELIKGKS